MPVTGLPAAAEALLTTLLATQGLTSWKVTADESNNQATVVVLRFKPGSSQPSSNIKADFWRRKPPSQRRRDQQRRRQYLQRSEYIPSSSVTFHPFEKDCLQNDPEEFDIAHSEMRTVSAAAVHESQNAREAESSGDSCSESVSAECQDSESAENAVTAAAVHTEQTEIAGQEGEVAVGDEEAAEITLEDWKRIFSEATEEFRARNRRNFHRVDDSVNAPTSVSSKPSPTSVKETARLHAAASMRQTPSANVQNLGQLPPDAPIIAKSGIQEGTADTRRGRNIKDPDKSPVRRFLRSSCK